MKREGEHGGLDGILSFASYLKSPIVEIVVGAGASATVLRAHQALLLQSPELSGQIATLDDDEVRHP